MARLPGLAPPLLRPPACQNRTPPAPGPAQAPRTGLCKPKPHRQIRTPAEGDSRPGGRNPAPAPGSGLGGGGSHAGGRSRGPLCAGRRAARAARHRGYPPPSEPISHVRTLRLRMLRALAPDWQAAALNSRLLRGGGGPLRGRGASGCARPRLLPVSGIPSAPLRGWLAR